MKFSCGTPVVSAQRAAMRLRAVPALSLIGVPFASSPADAAAAAARRGLSLISASSARFSFSLMNPSGILSCGQRRGQAAKSVPTEDHENPEIDPHTPQPFRHCWSGCALAAALCAGWSSLFHSSHLPRARRRCPKLPHLVGGKRVVEEPQH